MRKKGNTYKRTSRKENRPSKGRTGNSGIFSLFRPLEQWLKIEDLSVERFSSAYMPQIMFLMCLGILYIGNGHFAENTIRKINVTQKRVEDLRADYHTLKADYMFDSKQSEVATKVKKSGLRESYEPPLKIIAEQ